VKPVGRLAGSSVLYLRISFSWSFTLHICSSAPLLLLCCMDSFLLFVSQQPISKRKDEQVLWSPLPSPLSPLPSPLSLLSHGNPKIMQPFTSLGTSTRPSNWPQSWATPTHPTAPQRRGSISQVVDLSISGACHNL
jgi:hypothetical protein